MNFPVAAQTLTTIATNGPTSNRVNLVFFSEGYTSAQLGQFLSDVTNAMDSFFSVQPYTEYSNYFNVFAISVASVQSGCDDPNQGTTANTYFNSSFDDSEHIITIPPNAYDSKYNDGQGKVDSLLRTFLPLTNNDLSAMLVNTAPFTEGGSDNYGKIAISSVMEDNYILVHESGHTLGNLGDEYTTSNPGFPTNEEPNTTTQTNLALIKWRAWIPDGTPIPTPPTEQYVNTVGLFEGAHYHATGWYRPTFDSRMQSIYSTSGFGPVNQEALILAIYGKVRPLDGYSPGANNFSVTSAQMLTFNLNLLKPSMHALDVQWRTNGAAVAGATNSVFNIWPSQLGNGSQKIEADISDDTDFVRTDTRHVLKQTNVWTLNVTLPPSMQMDSVKWQTNGNFIFRVTGNSPDGVAIQTSTDLLNWVTLQTNPLASSFFYTNFGAFTSSAKRFYRTKTPP